MKLFAKIFLCTVVVITLSLSITGYVMISGSFDSAIKREYTNSLNEHQMIKFALQSAMLSNSEAGSLSDDMLLESAEHLGSVVGKETAVAVFSDDGKEIYSTFTKEYPINVSNDVSHDELNYGIVSSGDTRVLTVEGKFTQSGKTVLLISSRDITPIFEEKHLSEKRFFTTYLIAELAGAGIMVAIALLITTPIKRLIRNTRAFASGKTDIRTKESGSDEIGELSGSFNDMADTIESNISELELAAKQKDDFVASFAHELKTPLTSVIGYADMIYQRNDLSKDEIHDAAGYILNEGMRLEKLSLKLMDLFVLDKHNFQLAQMPADEVMNDIVATVMPVAEKNRVVIGQGIQKAYIAVEFDLFKTLMLNLIDNGIKAGARLITISGALNGNKYHVSVTDNGKGIPADQLERITEAFYMLDKSRSRAQHGAGLGLAIASRIAEVHGTKLSFTSTLGKGTKVSFELKGDSEK